MNRSSLHHFSLIKISSLLFFGLSFLIFSSACRVPEKEIETVLEVVEVTATPKPTTEPTATATAVPDHIAVTFEGDLENFHPGDPLILHFNQPMAPRERPLSFSPTINGTFVWSENYSTVTFTPDSGFGPQNYTVTLPKNTTSASGQTLDQLQRWVLDPVKAPTLLQRSPNGSTVMEQTPTITLRFSETMDEKSVIAALSVEPDIPFAVETSAREAIITMDEPLAFGTKYTFTLSKTAVSAHDVSFKTPYTWSIELADPIARFKYPGNDNHLAPIQLTFNYPIDDQSFSQAFNIKPDVRGKISWNASHTEVTFTPIEQLPAQTNYEISFDQPRDDAHWNFNLAYYDVNTEEVVHLSSIFPGADNMNPVVDNQGRVYFLSDRDGYRNIYMLDPGTDDVYKVTDILTGVSGITLFSSAISISENGKKLYYSHYTDNSYSIYDYSPDPAEMEKVDPSEVDMTAALLPTYTRRPRQTVRENLSTLDQQSLINTAEFDREKYKPNFQLDYIGGGGGIGVSTGNFLGTTTGLVGGIDMIFSDMLGNNQIYSTVALNGEIYDFGAQAMYRNQSGRIGWGGSLSHVPFRYGGYNYRRDTLPVEDGSQYGYYNKYETYTDRIFRDQVSMFTQYAFNKSIRVEAGGGYSLYYYRSERFDSYYDDFGRLVYQDREKLPSPDGFGLFDVQAAFVGDNSTFGFASPLDGYRFRLGVTQNFGHWNYLTVLADIRKYFYLKKSSFAFRVLQYGNYGDDANDSDNFFSRNYLIDPRFIRGFSKLSSQELSGMGLSNNDIQGSKLFIANAEFRVPFTGPEQLALIPTNFILSELAFFYDAGAAWSRNNPFDAPEGFEPKLLHSVGAALRINLFGSLILEPFYAYPLNEGGKGSFGVNFVPGW